mgnify:CR=1 FL=1
MRNVVKPLKGKTMNQFVPKLFDVMKGYSKKQFVNDVIAGIIVAIIALPLSIAPVSYTHLTLPTNSRV